MVLPPRISRVIAQTIRRLLGPPPLPPTLTQSRDVKSSKIVLQLADNGLLNLALELNITQIRCSPILIDDAMAPTRPEVRAGGGVIGGEVRRAGVAGQLRNADV